MDFNRSWLLEIVPVVNPSVTPNLREAYVLSTVQNKCYCFMPRKHTHKGAWHVCQPDILALSGQLIYTYHYKLLQLLLYPLWPMTIHVKIFCVLFCPLMYVYATFSTYEPQNAIPLHHKFPSCRLGGIPVHYTSTVRAVTGTAFHILHLYCFCTVTTTYKNNINAKYVMPH